MKITKAIAAADAMRPNTIPEEQKARWLHAFEGRIAETMQTEFPPFVWPLEGEETELLMPPPHDDIYVLHLCVQIDNHDQETELYMNDAAISNAATQEALAWWRRNNAPKDAPHWRLAP